MYQSGGGDDSRTNRRDRRDVGITVHSVIGVIREINSQNNFQQEQHRRQVDFHLYQTETSRASSTYEHIADLRRMSYMSGNK